MTDAIRDELRALLAAAKTKPPWVWVATGPGEGDIALGGAEDPDGEFAILAPYVCPSCAEHGASCLAPSQSDAALIVAAVNALPALLADTPSVEPPKENIVQALPFPTTDASKWVAAFRETFPDANVDDGSMLGWFANAIEHGRGPDRPSVEPAGVVRTEASLHWALDATNPPPPEPDERTDRYYLYRKGWADRGNAIRDAALLPTQASDSPEPKETT